MIRFEDLPTRQTQPGFCGRFVHTQSSTLALWDIAEGAVAAPHAHPHEQTMQVLEGQFEMTVGEQTWVCTPGSIVIIPPNVPHGGRALTACRLLDTF